MVNSVLEFNMLRLQSIATATRALRNITRVSKTILKNTGRAHSATLAEEPNAIDHPLRNFECPRRNFGHAEDRNYKIHAICSCEMHELGIFSFDCRSNLH